MVVRGKKGAVSALQTQQSGFVLLRQLVMALDSQLDNVTFSSSVLPPLLAALAVVDTGSLSSTNSSVKIEALHFLSTYLGKSNSLDTQMLPYSVLESLLGPVISSCETKYYKITVQALSVLDSLVLVFGQQGGADGASSGIEAIYAVLMKLLETSDADLEVKESALTVLGTLMCEVKSFIPAAQVEGRILPLFLDKLSNELTRLVSLRVLSKMVLKGGLESIVDQVINACVSCMKLSHRQLVLAALTCLLSFMSAYPDARSNDQVILTQAAAMLSTINDPSVFCMLLSLTSEIIGRASGEHTETFKTLYMNPLLELVVSSPHLFSGSGVMDQFGRLWFSLVTSGALVTDGPQLVRDLVSQVKQITLVHGRNTAKDPDNSPGLAKQSFLVVAHAVVSLCCFEQVGVSIPSPDWVKPVQAEITGQVYGVVRGIDKSSTESEKYLCLLILGEIGQQMYVCGTLTCISVGIF